MYLSKHKYSTTIFHIDTEALTIETWITAEGPELVSTHKLTKNEMINELAGLLCIGMVNRSSDDVKIVVDSTDKSI